MHLSRYLSALIVTAPALLAPLAGHASEGANTHYLPGTVATMIDLVPTQPGWVIEPMYLHYKADSGNIDNIRGNACDVLYLRPNALGCQLQCGRGSAVCLAARLVGPKGTSR